MSKPPVHVIRYGLIKATIWQNHTKSGERHTVCVCRLFKDGNEWRESSRFGRDDLLVLAKVVDQAHTWIHQSTQTANHEAALGTQTRALSKNDA